MSNEPLFNYQEEDEQKQIRNNKRNSTKEENEKDFQAKVFIGEEGKKVVYSKISKIKSIHVPIYNLDGRKDAFGNMIDSEFRKQKICFDQELEKVHYVENWKEHNINENERNFSVTLTTCLCKIF